MRRTTKSEQKTFYKRKAARRLHYENYIKGWRLRDCHTCDGNTADCPTCSGSGQEWAKPNCTTDIKSLIGKTLRIEVIPEVDLHLHIQNNRRVIKQFISTDDDTREPRIYDKLEF